MSSSCLGLDANFVAVRTHTGECVPWHIYVHSPAELLSGAATIVSYMYVYFLFDFGRARRILL